MNTILWIILATGFVSLISLIGLLFFVLKEKSLNKALLVLVSLAAGALTGGAFLHLIPEALEESPEINIFISVLAGFAIFFLIEKILHWRHCHKIECKVHTFAQMSLIGDGIHNLLDGAIIAAAFMTNTSLGIATTIAVAIHEIPQELGDFGVLVHGGFKKKKALMLNLLFALTAVAGGVLTYIFSTYTGGLIHFLVPFAAGGFIYIAASDLIPELRKETNIKKSAFSFLVFLGGIFLMYLLTLV